VASSLKKNMVTKMTRFLERCNCFEKICVTPGRQNKIPFMAKKTPKSVKKANSSQKQNLVTLFHFVVDIMLRDLLTQKSGKKTVT
jgi:hypothetical protein